MRIVYDGKEKVYLIRYPEAELCVNTTDIVEAKRLLLDRIGWEFDEAIRERFLIVDDLVDI